MLIAFWDTETNGLLTEATKMHCVGVITSAGQVLSGADQPGYVPIRDTLRVVEAADLRVAHNGDDFDERVTRKLYPWFSPKEGSRSLDTLLISRLLYPSIYGQGPNTMKCPPRLRMSHSLEAWGWRLGEKKDKEFDAGDWQTWSPEMSSYMDQDVVVLKRLFTWLMSRKPPEAAVKLEHDFARIIRRQERWGFTFDMDKALELQAELGDKARTLEADLIEDFGEFWMAGAIKVPSVSREVKLSGFPDVTLPRWGTKGNPLKPYVGPPKCGFEAGCPYTPVDYVQFQPNSKIHVEKMLRQRHNWKPVKKTEKGGWAIDDEVLRALPYPETPKLADLYGLSKIWGYVSQGKKAWMKTAHDEGDQGWRQHGRVNTIGTYTFRPSFSDPNMGQVPSRDPHYGPLCRSLFTSRGTVRTPSGKTKRFRLLGFDGSGIQLRLMSHHMARFDGGAYASNFEDPEFDPHVYMRDAIGVDLMGEGHPGRAKGKTINYALPFGGGPLRLGSIVSPNDTEARRRALGLTIKARLAPTFGRGFEAMKEALKEQVESKGYVVGLDGRKAYTGKAHTALSTLLQCNESVIMRTAGVLFDAEMQNRGWTPGVNSAGIVCLDEADYEFTCHVYDEYQVDVVEEALPDAREIGAWCVAEAGRRFNLKVPLTSDVKEGDTWSETH